MKCLPHVAPVLALSLLFGCWACIGSGATAYVSQSGEPNTTLLLPALKNSSINKIVLVGDYVFGTEFDGYIGHPLIINRNISIIGAPGLLPVLDLASKPGVLEICSTCIFGIKDVALYNESAQGTTSGSSAVVSILQGRAGSRVDIDGVVGVRTACLPTNSSLAILNNTQRSPLFPRPGGEQLVNATDVTYQGKTYTHMLGVKDISSDVALQLVSGGAYVGGYAVRRRNSVRICENIISAQCLANNSPEACVQLFAGSLISQAAGAAAAGGGPASLAAIVAPVVIGGVLLILAAAALSMFLRRRRRRRRQQHEQHLLPASSKQIAAAAGGGDAALLSDQNDDDPESGRSQQPSQTVRLISQQQQQRQQQHVMPVSLQHTHSGSPTTGTAGTGPSSSSRRVSWLLAWSQTAPSMQWVDDDDMDIQLGPLLGAGSFARVFKARWAGLDVAVKVIQHDSTTSATVANEVQLMMRLNHPNIVRAYHCVTRQLQQQHQTADFGSSRASSSANRLIPDTPALAAASSTAAPQAVARSRHQSPNRVLERTEIASKSGSSFQHQQQQQQDFRVPSASGRRLVSFESVMPDEDPNHLTVVVPIPRLPSDMPATPSVVTPGFDIPSSVISSLVPTDPGTSSLGTIGLSASTTGIRTLSGSISRTLSGSTGGVVRTLPDPGGAAYVRKGDDSPASTSILPQTLGQPLQQADPSSVPSATAAAAASAAAAAAGSSVSAAEGSPQPRSSRTDPQPRRLSTIYSASGTASTGTVSNSESNGGVSGPAAVAAGAGGEQHEQRHMGTLDSPVVEAAGSRGSKEIVPAAAGAAGSGAGGHRDQGNSSAVETVPGGSTFWPVIIEEQQQQQSLQHQQQSGSQNNSKSSAALAATSPSAVSSTAVAVEGNAVACETWLVTELCDHGTLARVAADWRPAVDDTDMLRLLVLLLDVARGLKLLHAKHIVHADLNAHNVLVSSGSTAPYGLVAKIADLGLSRIIKQHATHRTTRTVGTLSHQPPELLRDGHSSTAVDVYSFGIMMWELYTGQAAFTRMRYGQIYHQVVICDARPAVPPEMPDDYQLLMASCWSSGPDERPSVDMLLHCIELMVQDRQQGKE